MPLPPVERFAPLIQLLTDDDAAALAAVFFAPHDYRLMVGGVIEDGGTCPRATLPSGMGRQVCCLFGVPMLRDAGPNGPDEAQLDGGAPSRDDILGWLRRRRGFQLEAARPVYGAVGPIEVLVYELTDLFDAFYSQFPGEDVNAWVRQLLALRQPEGGTAV